MKIVSTMSRRVRTLWALRGPWVAAWVLLSGLAIYAPAVQAQSALSSVLGDSVTQIATGTSHTCALTTAGGVQCWGSNAYGQLGDNSLTDSLTPVAVSGLASGVLAISAGREHSCAVTAGGGAKCWGRNQFGQLGNSSKTNSPVPTTVSGLGSGVLMISAGWSHSCAVTAAGAAMCWGYNNDGELGNNSATNTQAPVAVTGLGSGVLSISAGQFHSCAVTTAGAAQCWGRNADGQLGNNTLTDSLTPTVVSGLGSGVVSITTAAYNSCALTSAGTVKCWGYNGLGQLGDDTTRFSTTPLTITGLGSAVLAISTMRYHACALIAGGAAKCWADNSFGELGDNSTTRSSRSVTVSTLGSGVQAISAGGTHSCALTVAGAVRCWGDNSLGQLGNNSTTGSLTPVSVPILGNPANTLSTGLSHSCALTTAGGVQCWGANSAGQLGNNSTTNSPTAVAVSGLSNSVTAISAGASHNCALTTVGAVWCWGTNAKGELGNGSTTDSSIPIVVIGLSSGVLAISTNEHHSCALITGGAVKCWGQNFHGQLGNGNTTDSPTPVAVSGLSSGVQAISAGAHHSCALTSAGAVQCWGYNGQGQLGNGGITDSLTPVSVSGLSNGVTAISAGGYHSCALTAAGGVQCWGDNSNGALGNGSTTGSSTPVAAIGLGSGVKAISAGSSHACALTTAGGVQCWGLNFTNQLGDGTNTKRLTPVAVIGLSSGMRAISSGYFHSCALTTAGGVQCWGDNSASQLGNNSTTSHSVPVAARAGQSIAFAPAATILLNGTLSLSGTASSGATVSFDTWTPTTCSVSGTTVTAIGALGYLCGVRASQVGGNDASDNNFAPAPQELRVIRIIGIAPVFTSTNSTTFSIGISGSFSITTTGIPAATVSVSGLPAWLTFTAGAAGSGTATLTGTPPPGTASPVTFTLNATNGVAPGASQIFTLTVLKQPQTISNMNASPTSPVYAPGGSFTMSASASSSLPVSFTIAAASSTVCSITPAGSATVTILTAGSCMVLADQAGDGTYLAATQVPLTVTITTAQTITAFAASPAAPAYAANGTFTVSATGGASSNPVVFTIAASSGTVCRISSAPGSNTVTMLSTGSCTVLANQAGNSNYSAAAQVTLVVPIGVSGQTLSFPAQSTGSRVFTTGGGASFPIGPIATGGASGSPIVYSVVAASSTVCSMNSSTGVVTILSIGTCTIQADQAGNANYAAATPVTQSVTITVAPQTITAFASSPAALQYRPNGSFTVAAAGGASGNPVLFTIAASSSSVCSISPAGSRTVTTLSGGICTVLANQTGNANYTAAAQVTLVVPIGTSETVVPVPTLDGRTLLLLSLVAVLVAAGAMRRRRA